MARTRPAPGGGIVVEIGADRLTGWVNRFAGRNDGLASIESDAEDGVLLTAADLVNAGIALLLGRTVPGPGNEPPAKELVRGTHPTKEGP